MRVFAEFITFMFIMTVRMIGYGVVLVIMPTYIALKWAVITLDKYIPSRRN